MSRASNEAEGFVLAGGRSSRMGQDKALIKIGDRTLVERSLEVLRKAGLQSRIAGAQSELSDFAHVIPDLPGEAGLGPLAGVCAALSSCVCRFAAFLPVDLPLIPASLIEYLVHHAVVTESAVTLVSVAGFVQTFPAIVECGAREALRQSLHSDDRNCQKAFRRAGSALAGGFNVLAIELLVQPGRVRHPRNVAPGQWFLNVNAPDHLKILEELMASIAER